MIYDLEQIELFIKTLFIKYDISLRNPSFSNKKALQQNTKGLGMSGSPK